MAVFQYRAADHAGKVVDGIMEAEAEHGVVSRLHEMGFIPLKIAAPGESRSQAVPAPLALFSRKKVTQQELLHFTQELSTLLAAGLPLDRSLSTLANLVRGKSLDRLCVACSKGFGRENRCPRPWPSTQRCSRGST